MRISDWSSDVCSSDLADRDDAQDDRDGDDVLGVLSHGMYLLEPDAQARHETSIVDVIALATAKVRGAAVCALPGHADVRRELARSEERRVGKGCVSTWRSRWSPDH